MSEPTASMHGTVVVCVLTFVVGIGMRSIESLWRSLGYLELEHEYRTIQKSVISGLRGVS